MSAGYRITKREWTRDGGLANPLLYRRFVSGRWQYYRAWR